MKRLPRDRSEPANVPYPPGPPMTLGNMRSLGVRSLDVSCVVCHHEAILPADGWPDAALVRAFGPRMVCTRCGIIGADARPNWREMRASGNWGQTGSIWRTSISLKGEHGTVKAPQICSPKDASLVKEICTIRNPP